MTSCLSLKSKVLNLSKKALSATVHCHLGAMADSSSHLLPVLLLFLRNSKPLLPQGLCICGFPFLEFSHLCAHPQPGLSNICGPFRAYLISLTDTFSVPQTKSGAYYPVSPPNPWLLHPCAQLNSDGKYSEVILSAQINCTYTDIFSSYFLNQIM